MFPSAGSGIAQSLSLREWPQLAAAVDVLFDSPELDATLEAVVAVLLGHAESVIVSLADSGQRFRIAATGARDEERRQRIALHLHEPDSGKFAGAFVRPLGHVGSEFGRIYLDGVVGGPLLEAIVQRCAQALSNARRFEHERHVALTFQTAAVSQELPKCESFRFSAIYVAGRSEALVGGDWYDAFPVDDGRTIVSIGDVEGSGLEAALAMVTVRQTIRALAMVQPDPSVMLAGANRALFAQHPQRYVTAFVGILDPVTRRCTYANAGHPPPMVRHADGRIELAGGRDFPIGLVRDHTFEIHDVAMSEGAVMLLYTDGLTEATHDVVAGEERLEGLLTGLDPATTENIAYAIYEGMPQSRDDVAILGVVVGKLPPFRRWRFDPRYEDLSVRVRAALRDEILQIGFSTEQITNLEAIFAELVANALRHAPGAIEVILQSQRDSVVLHMLDRGPGFSANGTLPNDLFSESGRGLFLVRHFSDDFVVERRAGKGSHTRVTLLNTRKETQ